MRPKLKKPSNPFECYGWDDINKEWVAIAVDEDGLLSVSLSAAGLATEATLLSIDSHVDQIEGYVDQIEGYVDQIEGYVDGIEGLLFTIDADTSALSGTVSGGRILTTEASGAAILAAVDGIEGILTTMDADTSLLATTVSGGRILTTEASAAAILAAVDQIEGYVDGIEGLIGTTNTTLTTIDGRVDGLETLIGTTNTTLTTIDGRVDGIEGLLGTIDGHVDQIEGYVDGIEGSLSSLVTVFGTNSLLTLTQADNLANTTDTLNVSALGYVFDGATWDRMRGDATDGLLVNLGANNDITFSGGTIDTITNPVTVTQSDQNNLRALVFQSDPNELRMTEANSSSIESRLASIQGYTDDIEGYLLTLSGAVSGTEFQVDVVTSTLPTGASTSALQTTGNSSLATIASSLGLMDNAIYISGSGPITYGTVIFGQNGGNPKEFALDASGNIIETNSAAIAASASILDDWDESDRAKVNVIAGVAGVDGGSGVVSSATQRVVLATNVALPTGSNAIGKLAANSGVDIGDVDVLTVSGQSLTFGVGAVAAGTLRMTHASDDPVNASLDEIETAIDATNDLMKMQIKPVAVSTYDGTWVQNLSFTEALIVGSARNLLKFVVYNAAAAERFLQFHNDVDGVIADGTAPKLQYLVPAKSQIILGPGDLGPNGIHFSIGISVTQSTIHGSYADATRGTAGDLRVDVNYI